MAQRAGTRADRREFTRSTEPFRNRMFDFAGLNELLGTPDMLEHGKRYASDPQAEPAGKRGV